VEINADGGNQHPGHDQEVDLNRMNVFQAEQTVVDIPVSRAAVRGHGRPD
jgi:hypothetical protein